MDNAAVALYAASVHDESTPVRRFSGVMGALAYKYAAAGSECAVTGGGGIMVNTSAVHREDRSDVYVYASGIFCAVIKDFAAGHRKAAENPNG